VEVTVHDLIIVHRTVEIPDECPKCNVILLEYSVWEYQDQHRHATIDSTKREGAADDDLEWPDLPIGGESFLYLKWRCPHCNEEFANSIEINFYEDNVPEAVEQLLLAKPEESD
jgi:phage FluMu protein Com